MRETNVLLIAVVTLGLKIQQKNCHVCEHQLTKPNGSFTSPNYPSYYKDNLECKWNIRAPANYSIEIVFHDFQLEKTFSYHQDFNRQCICDYVKILKETAEGHHGNMTIIGIYCMMRNYPPRVIEISSSHVTVIFRSDSTISAKGFQASYKMKPPYSGNITDSTSFPTTESTVTTPTDKKSTSLTNSTTEDVHPTPNLTVTSFASSEISTIRLTTKGFSTSFKASPTTIFNKTVGFVKHAQKETSFSLAAVVVPLVTMVTLLLALVPVWYSRRRKQLKAQNDQQRIYYGNDNDGFSEKTITVETNGGSSIVSNTYAEESSQKKKFPVSDDIQEHNLSMNNEAVNALSGQKQNDNPLYSSKTPETFQDNCLYYGEQEYIEKAVKKGRSESLASLYAISGPILETSFMENNGNNVYESLPRVNEAEKPRTESLQSLDSHNSLYAVSDVKDSCPVDETFVSTDCPLYERLI